MSNIIEVRGVNKSFGGVVANHADWKNYRFDWSEWIRKNYPFQFYRWISSH